MKSKFNDLVDAITEEYKKAEKAFILSKKSAEEIAESSSASPSQSGDRFHSQGTADLAKQKFETISLLKKEIEEKGEYVCVEDDNEILYLVDNPVFIKGFKIVSTKSPLGIKLIKK